jgi:hypothetical protein
MAIEEGKSGLSSFRIISIFLVLLVAGGAAYWVLQPKSDIRYTRFETDLRRAADKASTISAKLPRNTKLDVKVELKESGSAFVFVDSKTGGFVALSDIDPDRRPVLTGAYVAKALLGPVKLRDEPSPLAPIVDEIPARTVVQIWGQTETKTGKWVEITRNRERAVGYIPLAELEAASHQLR